jgi:hypothetical protein
MFDTLKSAGQTFSRAGSIMKNDVITVSFVLLLFCLAISYTVNAVVNVKLGVENDYWIKYDVVSEERNFTGWEKIEIYSVDGTFFRFNTTTYSDNYGYSHETGKYNMSEMDSHPAAYPDDTIEFIVIPADLKTGDTFHYYNWGPTTIAGESNEIFAGATRQTIYATYTPPNGMHAEASKVEYKWDKALGIALEFLAYYPDGKTSSGKLSDTNIWQPTQEVNSNLVYAIIFAAIIILAVSILFVVKFKRRKRVS